MQLRGQNEALAAAHKSGNLAELKTAWASVFNGGEWECNRFMNALKNAPEADDLYSTPCEEVRLPQGSWSKGRVVAIGDAAHAHTANGFGTTWGMVGSYILAGEIATLYKQNPTTAVVQAVKKYEGLFRPIATAQHGEQGMFREALFMPKSAFGIWVLHSVARAAAYFKLEQGMGMSSKTANWRVPEYPALNVQN
jgi:2-polyprenyl-6-methoxyphenol hydroxylase-like FAD-dependent oxidoreductase